MERAQVLYAILDDVYQGQSPWSLTQIEADLNKPDTDCFVAMADGEMVGFLTIQDLVGELEITNIAVKSSYQGRGLADQLMANLADLDQPIFLEVRASNQAAQRLYIKHGFVAVGNRKNYYHNPTEDAVVMKRG
ncbi:ribosomal-protein-alanine N-acetyltransferase [Streptococcus rupicaprae]|uniref:[Ribosomal protein bS18]-alanine N-acetyltransferase n=1 Tax=Streptococcus rupicaprae TaxID=759619 RepID=A0ABV2FHU6_9STRE